MTTNLGIQYFNILYFLTLILKKLVYIQFLFCQIIMTLTYSNLKSQYLKI